MQKPIHPARTIAALLFLGAVIMDVTGISFTPDVNGKPGGSMIFGLFLASPVFGFFILYRRFMRWLDGCHCQTKDSRR